MAENTTIEWTDATFSPWWGCTKVSPGCENCYAERQAARFAPTQVLWGPGSSRRTFNHEHWMKPLKWDAASAKRVATLTHFNKDVHRMRVFCAPMADVFDKDAPAGERDRLWKLIRRTPNIDWQILTKRIGNAKDMLPADWGDGYPNVWLGATIVNREELLRDGPKLAAVPARVHFWSCEPLLEDLGDIPAELLPQWVIVGSESGPRARRDPEIVNWVRSIKNRCASAGVAFFWKQDTERGRKISTPELDGRKWVEFPS